MYAGIKKKKSKAKQNRNTKIRASLFIKGFKGYSAVIRESSASYRRRVFKHHSLEYITLPLVTCVCFCSVLSQNHGNDSFGLSLNEYASQVM